MFCNTGIVLFLYYEFFSHPIFWGGTASLVSSEETSLYTNRVVTNMDNFISICMKVKVTWHMTKYAAPHSEFVLCI